MTKSTAESYRVFVRNWWRKEYSHTNSRLGARSYNLVPDPGARKTTLARHCTYEEAKRICEEYGRTHKPGPLSRKAEFEREG